MQAVRSDVHQTITDTIVAAIERGAGEFHLPWHRSARNIMRPINVASQKPYRGVNILSLWATADARGYSSGTWGTFRQWRQIGAQVRKGEKAAFVVFYKELQYTAGADDGSAEKETRLCARATPVFASEQVDGYSPPEIEEPKTPFQSIQEAEAFVVATSATIVHGGDRAFYRPSTDSIHLPPRSNFRGSPTSSPEESYYATVLHELTHWTSNATRCDRQLGKRFGDQAYAMEELVAELAAAFLCADLGIAAHPREDHAQYLGHWLAVLKADKKAIFTAASRASEAVAFLERFRSASAAVLTVEKATPGGA